MPAQSETEQSRTRLVIVKDEPSLWEVPWKAGALSLLASGFGTLALVGSLAMLGLLDHRSVLTFLTTLANTSNKQLYTVYAGAGIVAGIILWIVAGVVYGLIVQDLRRKISLEYEKRDAAMAAIGATRMSVNRSESVAQAQTPAGKR